MYVFIFLGVIVSIVCFQVNFFGRVQGVGFRFLCLKKANSLGVNGWVSNSEKSDLVEAVFCGEEKKINELINYLKSNNGFTRVDKVTITEINSREKFSNFKIKY